MNPELLRTIHFSMEVVTPPMGNMEKSQLAELYSKIIGRYDYDSYNFLGNGAQFANNTGSLIRILSDRIFFQEDNLQADIQIYIEKTIDILKMIKDRYNLQAYLFQVITLRALWTCNPDLNSRDLLLEKVIKCNEEDWARLERPIAGAGIRINMPGNDNVMDVRIEPWFRDLSQLFIELRGEFPKPVQEIDNVGQRTHETYHFLFENIQKLIIGL